MGTISEVHKQPSRGVLKKRRSENMQLIFRRIPISIKLPCNFIEIILRHGCSSVILLHIFRTPFLKNTSGRLFLDIVKQCIPEKNLFIHLDFASALSHYVATYDIHSSWLFYLNVYVFSAFIAHDERLRQMKKFLVAIFDDSIIS